MFPSMSSIFCGQGLYNSVLILGLPSLPLFYSIDSGDVEAIMFGKVSNRVLYQLQ
jgi:hypothetical protein